MTQDATSAAPTERRDRLKQLRAFCETARFGNFSRAAEYLMSSQPAVSTQVRALEEQLGVHLFQRRGPRIVLTRVGEDLYRIAMPLVQGFLQVPELFAEQHHGVEARWLRIGAGEVSAAYLLPEPLKRFRARHPGVRIELKTGSGATRLDWLRSFEIDVVVVAVDVVDALPPDIEFFPWCRSEAVLVTPEDHPLADQTSVTLESVIRYPLVAPLPGSYTRQIHDMALRLRGVNPRVVLEVEGWGAVMNNVAAGVGVAFVPDVCVTEFEPVRQVRLTPRPVHRVYGAAVRRDRLITNAADRFVRLLIDDAKEPVETPAP